MSIELLQGNCIDVMQDLIDDGVKVDLTVTSPPYDNLRTYEDTIEWDFNIFKKVADLLYYITTDGGIVVWIINDSTINGSKTCNSFNQAIYFKQIGFNVHDVMLFAKNNPIPQIFHKRYTDAFEYMFILSKGKPNTCNPLKEPCKNAGKIEKSYKKISQGKQVRHKGKVTKTKEFKIKNNIWYYSVGSNTYGHPATFPLQLAVDHIISWSNPDDTVLDPFMGSGTTGVACLQNGRNFIGIELVEDYYNIAKERCSEFQSKLM